eukprot:161770-Chlamydomonas_euryale.AAC.3
MRPGVPAHGNASTTMPLSPMHHRHCPCAPSPAPSADSSTAAAAATAAVAAVIHSTSAPRIAAGRGGRARRRRKSPAKSGRCVQQWLRPQKNSQHEELASVTQPPTENPARSAQSRLPGSVRSGSPSPGASCINEYARHDGKSQRE